MRSGSVLAGVSLKQRKVPASRLGLCKPVKKLIEKTIHRNFRLDVGRNSVYGEKVLFDNLVELSVSKESAESRADLRVEGVIAPSPDILLYHVEKFRTGEIQAMLDNALDQTVEFAQETGLLSGSKTVALDFHDKSYYGDKNDDHVVGTKKTKSTHWCHQYATAYLAESGVRLTLAAEPVGKLASRQKVLKTLLDKAVKHVGVRLLLVDRGFFSAETMLLFMERGVAFLMPAVKNRRVQKLMRENRGNLPAVVEYTMEGNTGKKAKFNLVLVREKDEVFAFATNLPVKPEEAEKLVGEYCKRFGIETSYREQNRFLARTCTKKYSVRLLYFLLSCCLYNIWVLSNLLLSLKLNHGIPHKPLFTVRRLKLALGLCFSSANTAAA